MYRVVFSKISRKSLRKLNNSGRFDKEATGTIINLIAKGEPLEPRCQNHLLHGEYVGCFECHIKNDLLLIYELDEIQKVLTIVNIGSHSELFG